MNRDQRKGTPMSESTLFQLSRIYAGGWLAGRNSPDTDPADMDSVADRLNPYQAPAESQRWNRGFKDAVLRIQGIRVKSLDRLVGE